MRIPYRWRPSVGFVWLVVALFSCLAFFAWGSATPALEQVWRLDIELRLAERPPLSGRELAQLRGSLRAHPELGDFLTEDKHAGIFSANDDGQVEGDYAYLVRPGRTAAGFLEVRYVGTGQGDEVAVTVRTANSRATGKIAPAAPFRWRLPDDEPFPQLVEIRLDAGGKIGRHPVQIDLGVAP